MSRVNLLVREKITNFCCFKFSTYLFSDHKLSNRLKLAFLARGMMKTRCPWLNLQNEEYVRYHDLEWGKPIYDDDSLFAALVFEGAQAGLSWETVLKKRKEYLRVFNGLKIDKTAKI